MVGEVSFLEHEGGPGLDHFFGVAGLVVICRRGKRHEECGLPCCCEFRDSGCAAAGHDEIGLGEAGGHVIEESAHPPSGGSAPLSR